MTAASRGGVLAAVAAALVSWSAVLAQNGAPQIFAPGIISTEAPEFAIAFSPDGREVYFNRASADRSSFPIYVSRRSGATWSAPALVPFAAEGRHPDPFVTPDGGRLYFSSNRPKTAGAAVGDFDTWYVDRLGDGWGAPANPGPVVNSDRSETFVSASRDGTLYFGSDRGGIGEVYRARRRGAAFEAPERLPDVINAGGAGNPAISADGRRLFFVARRDGGMGGADLYVSDQRGGQWGAPRNLGPQVNSPQADFAPALSPDGQRLYFTSERPGIVTDPGTARPPGDIYWIELASIGIR